MFKKKSSKKVDLIFAFFHLGLLLAILVYGIIGLVHGNLWRFGTISLGLAIYYFVVLHKPVRREIARRKKNKESP
jgi:4-hydroxybenzoate polyprenyltransferase